MDYGIDGFDPSEWTVVKTVPNPWGQVPLTAGGQSLPARARKYMDRLVDQRDRADPSHLRRHHYVPRSYLSEWSFDTKRTWALDTTSGQVRPIGLRHACVEENFYRVVGPSGVPHNRVELMFGVVDEELRRIQRLFNGLDDVEVLEFDDSIGLGVTMAVQRMRTVQERRLRLQHNAWLVAQNPDSFTSIADDENPYRLAGIHTELLFSAMWDAADVLTTRQIEIWDDPRERFLTCDAPVLTPFIKNQRPGLLHSEYVLWPISPRRVIALARESEGRKAILRKADGELVGIVRKAVEQGRERMIFASASQLDRLPTGKKFRRRAQIRLRCSPWTPQGELVPSPGCCVELREAFSDRADVVLCSQGLHRTAPGMARHL